MSNEILQRYADLYRDNGRSFSFKHDGYEIVEKGSWEQDHKYQLRQVVVLFEGVYIALYESRTGSYHSDWEDGGTSMQIVERHERPVIVIDWTVVGDAVEVLPDWS